MGVVYYATYLAYFETGRVEALRQVGLTYADVVERGIHLAVLEASARYVKPARYDDLVLVTTTLGELGMARFSLLYELHRESDGELLVTGHTTHACVDARMLKPLRLPAWLRDTLSRLRAMP
jgi:acyl-CoA thioester hydrolase